MKLRLLAAMLALTAAPVALAAPAVSQPARPCHSPEIDALRSLIYEKREYRDSVTRGEELLNAAVSAHGEESLEAACVEELLSKAMRSSGMLADGSAMRYAENAYSLKRRSLGEEHAETMSALSNYAWTQYASGDIRGSLDSFRKVLEIRTKIFGPDAIETAWSHENLGNILVDLGEYEEARDHLEESLRIGSDVLDPDDPQLVDTYHSLARALRNMGYFDQAREMLEDALSIAEKAGDQRIALTTECLVGLTALMDDSADDVGALEYGTRALALARERARDEPLRVATCLNNVARAHRNLGDFGRAQAEIEEALAIVQEHSGEEDDLASTLIFNLAEIDADIGETDQARALHERALRIRQKLFGADHPYCGTSLESLAALTGKRGDHRAAIALYERALRIWRAKLAPDHPDIATSLNGEGLEFEALGEYDEAERRFAEALAIRRAGLGARHPLTAAVETNLASLLFEEGQSFRALNLAVEAESASRREVRMVSRELPERLAIGYSLKRASGLDTALNIAAAHPAGDAVERAWSSLIRSRAIVLDETATRRRSLTRSTDPRVRAAETDLAEARKRYAHLTIVGPNPEAPETYTRMRRQAEDAVEASESRLASLSAEFRRGLSLRQTGLQEVSAALPDSTALIAYVRYRAFPRTPGWGAAHRRRSRSAGAGGERGLPSYLAFVIPGRNERPRVVPLGGAGEIDGLVDRWERAVRAEPGSRAARAADADDGTAGRRLRERIWDQPAAHLGDVERVFVVPDGSLFLVDLATLPSGRGRYLVETAPVLHYLSTERDVIEAARPVAPAGGMLALGGPAFDAQSLFASLADSSGSEPARPAVQVAQIRMVRADDERDACGPYRAARFVDLPGSTEEARTVAGIWRRAEEGGHGGEEDGAVVLTGSAASEAAFKRSAPGRSILHIATHGFFMGGDCRSSSLLSRSLAFQGPAEERGPRPSTATNPLLLTGLALAGANNRDAAGPSEEDGILTAMEIASMDLSSARWAVLAGCDTGAGRIEAGEGVMGLRRAFRIAGARTIIMSLWSMKDSDARAWMTSLYRHRYVDGLSTAASVRQADLDLLNARRAANESTHPSSWGGWIASGAWN